MAFLAPRTLRTPPRLWRPALPHRHPKRPFHAQPFGGQRVQAGDAVPDVELMEHSPGNKVSLATELRNSGGRGLVIGVPAAFSPACSESHIPGYLAHAGLEAAGAVFVVSVNDPFVMKAWAESLDPEQKVSVDMYSIKQGTTRRERGARASCNAMRCDARVVR